MCRTGKDRRVNPRKEDIKPKHNNARPYKREKYDRDYRDQED